MKTRLCKHVFTSVFCARLSKLAGFRGGPLKHNQNQTEEFSSQRVIFMLPWTTAEDSGDN